MFFIRIDVLKPKMCLQESFRALNGNIKPQMQILCKKNLKAVCPVNSGSN
jgi:hypothetical protein